MRPSSAVLLSLGVALLSLLSPVSSQYYQDYLEPELVGSPMSGVACDQSDMSWTFTVTSGSVFACVLNTADLVLWIESGYVGYPRCQSGFEDAALQGTWSQSSLQATDPDKAFFAYNPASAYYTAYFDDDIQAWDNAAPYYPAYSNSPSSSSLSVGAIVGIVVGGIAGVVLICTVISLIAAFKCRGRNKNRPNAGDAAGVGMTQIVSSPSYTATPVSGMGVAIYNGYTPTPTPALVAMPLGHGGPMQGYGQEVHMGEAVPAQGVVYAQAYETPQQETYGKAFNGEEF